MEDVLRKYKNIKNVWLLMKIDNLLGAQQLVPDSKPSKAGHNWEQKWPSLHSSLESQSPSSFPQGIPDRQKSSSPGVAW